jgi:hypothetical protein
MSFHLMAYYGSVPTGSVYSKIPALQSVWETIQNSNLVVSAVNQIIGAYAYGPNMVRAQLQSPSLQAPGYPDLQPVAASAPVAGGTPAWHSYLSNPLALKTNEQLSAYSINGGTAAENELVALLLADKPPTPKTGRIITLRLTGATTLTAGAWTEVPLTFVDNLPVGNYSVVGARFQSAGALLGRVGFPGFGYRPGTVAVQSSAEPDVPGARMGGWGEWFTFNSTVQITAEFLSASADTAETVFLDLIGPQ